MATVEQDILALYTEKSSSQMVESPVDVLFDITVQYLKSHHWCYRGDADKQNFLELPSSPNGYAVNCFDLAEMFSTLVQKIGVPFEKCFSIKIKNFSALSNDFIRGGQAPFDNTLIRNSDGYYEFDVHVIAYVDGCHYDLLLDAKYSCVNDGVDIYHALYTAITDNDSAEFEYILPYLLDINEQKDGLTLLHSAYIFHRYDMANLLLRREARDDVQNSDNLSAHDTLTMNLNEAQKMKKLKVIYDIKKCYDCKMDMHIKNTAAIAIQSLWKGYKVRHGIKGSPQNINLSNTKKKLYKK